MILPQQATKLLAVLKEQMEKAKTSTDPAVQQACYRQAERIKTILINYQRHQRAQGARGQAQGQNAGSPAPGVQNQAGAGGANFAGNTMVGQQRPQGQVQGQTQPSTIGQQQQSQQMMGQQARAAGLPPVANTQGAQGAQGAQGPRPGTIPSAQVTPERYQQVRQRILEVEKKIQFLEREKKADLAPEKRAQIDSQLTEWRNKYTQFQRFANIIRSQLVEQARAASNQGTASAGGIGTTGAPGNASAAGMNLQGVASSPSMPSAAAAAAAAQNSAQRASVTQPAMGAAGSTPANRAGSPGSVGKAASGSPVQVPGATPGVTQGVGSGAGTPPAQNAGTTTSANGRSTSPQPTSKEANVPGVNLSGITKPSVPSMPISNTINVKPPAPVTLKPGANNVRPTLTGGGASGLGQIMGTPAVMRMPTYDMATTSAATMTDNGGRVLTKRKLSELINTIGADEGDGRTTVDGDVEELLLDLADEFVSSVTTFACRLAKHRKTDSVDVRDVQLHLERNWNIRIPGYAMDEIRSMRKWQPSSSYNQKVSGVEIAKAINGNMN